MASDSLDGRYRIDRAGTHLGVKCVAYVTVKVRI